MKQVEQVSIGRRAFTLESDAYELVNDYLLQLQAYYSKMENGAEVMDGIEERMAELLVEKAGEGNIVTRVIAGEVIDVLGRPEQIEDEAPAAQPATPGKVKKKLYRDIENKFVGGVCSGFAAFFGVDVVWFRLAFVILTAVFLFTPFLCEAFVIFPAIYFVCWICMPAARTVRQKCEMHGEDSTVDGIYEKVRYESVYDQPSSSKPAGSGLGRVCQVIIGLLLLVIGLSGILGGVAASVCCCTSLFKTDILPYVTDVLPTLSRSFVPTVIILALCIAFIPFIAMFYAGIMMTFNFKSPKWHPGLILFILWVLAIIALIVVAIFGGLAIVHI